MKQKLRIAQYAPLWESVPPALYGGIERIVYSLLVGLASRGHQVTLFASGDSTKEFPLISVCDVALFRDKLVKRPQAYNYLMLKKLLDKQADFDIIHDHTFYEPLIFSWIIKTPIVHTCHLEVPPEMKKLFDECGSVSYVTISESQKKLSGITNATVIYNGVEFDKYQVEDKPKSDYLVWLGRISHIKGTKEAILAARAAGEKLIIAGKINQEDQDYYKKEIEPLIDGEKVKFIGEVDDQAKSKLLGNAKALLNPINWDEPFGLVPVEALACGVPVIATRRGSMPEIIEDNVNGFLVDHWEEIPEKLKQLDLIDRKVCRSSAKDKFSIDTMVSKYEEFYYAQSEG